MHCDKLRLETFHPRWLMECWYKCRYIVFSTVNNHFWKALEQSLFSNYFHSLASEYRLFCHFLNAGKLCLSFSSCIRFLAFKMLDGLQIQSSCLSHTLTERCMVSLNNQKQTPVFFYSPLLHNRLRPLLSDLFYIYWKNIYSHRTFFMLTKATFI